MDKLTLISGTLFMAADVFAIVSLAMPDWIITDVGGKYGYVFITP
jgi:lariat debranching enzyme